MVCRPRPLFDMPDHAPTHVALVLTPPARHTNAKSGPPFVLLRRQKPSVVVEFSAPIGPEVVTTHDTMSTTTKNAQSTSPTGWYRSRLAHRRYLPAPVVDSRHPGPS